MLNHFKYLIDGDKNVVTIFSLLLLVVVVVVGSDYILLLFTREIF